MKRLLIVACCLLARVNDLQATPGYDARAIIVRQQAILAADIARLQQLATLRRITFQQQVLLYQLKLQLKALGVNRKDSK